MTDNSNATPEVALLHYGVKGMRWGVRRASGSTRLASAPVSTTSAKTKSTGPDPATRLNSPTPATRITPPAGTAKKGLFARKEKPPVELSEDAIQFREIRYKAKTKGVQSLTNEELKRVTERMNLQKKYNEVFPKPVNPVVQLLVNDTLVDFGATALRNIPAPHDTKGQKGANALKNLSSLTKSFQPKKK